MQTHRTGQLPRDVDLLGARVLLHEVPHGLPLAFHQGRSSEIDFLVSSTGNFNL